MTEIEDEVNVPVPTTAPSSQIKAIAKDTVHKICSGQVVLSLAVAVKELVENAIDAGATLVEVKLRDQGLEGFEVSDNGSGVAESNLEGMTAKYHTSKIREFDDLLGVETFGFRGEALSSLCALSDMAIQTRHSSADVAIRVELDHEGMIKKRAPCARGVGTTVTLSNLFATLPVRRRDFSRNIKKEFTKMCHILQAYCMVSKGVRIICSNQSTKGVKTVVLQTHGSQDVLANISAVFGTRQVADIVPLKSPLEGGQLSEESLRAELQSDNAADSTQFSSEDVERLNQDDFQLEGYISSCRHGAGRSSKDRQFYYVNSRPCDLKNVSKVLNDVYHRFNGQQQPFVYLNILTARKDVDVNLTPDKRQLLLNNEKILLLALKKALLNTFGNTPSTFTLQNSTIVSMLDIKPKDASLAVAPTKTEMENGANSLSEDSDVPVSSSQRFMDVLTQWRRTGDTKGVAPPVSVKRRCNDELAARTLKIQKIQAFLSQEEPSKELSYQSDGSSDMDTASAPAKKEQSPNKSIPNVVELKTGSLAYDELTQKATPIKVEATRIDCKVSTPAKPLLSFIEKKPKEEAEQTTLGLRQESVLPTTQDDSSEGEIELATRIEFDDPQADDQHSTYTCGELRTTIEEIALKLKAEERQIGEQKQRAKLERLRFKSDINPNQNQKAEAELQKEIGKEDFNRMDIIGQFNLGFIIVKLDDDLFIVDQHATDEKYNFETLQQTTELQYQRLTVPQTLELTTVNEMVLLDHLSVFEKNGFKFEINPDAPSTKKVRLLGKPYSKNWEFGKEDIDELIFMLQDAPEGTVCRPSRVRAMFASRACRKSVMIGKPLNKATMRTLINHMGEIEQPWNCPHGRPTMRHLINITMLMDADEDAD
ncbi:mismatch repair endonuclease PMS2 [Scaptodrosophila lebanonensis]|uniref:Mismatch repair endonuclease PMS2 n=1 Tax=Drosophila lebanonensis TaxID=7225 RepID=A0A6J2T165_DROLE|nr:mismatch repair endonuclease PMS2 [Scaptodrosophila lebanonensis]